MADLLKVKLITPSTKRVTINIPNPNKNITSQEATALMNAICNSNCFVFAAGSPTSPDYCELVTTEVETILG